MAHRLKSPSHPLVPRIIGPAPLLTAPVQPGVVVAPAQDDGLKLNRAIGPEQREVELRWSVILLEQKPQRMLRALQRLPVPSALNPQAAVDAKALPLRPAKHLDRSRALPGSPVCHRMCVDAGFGIEHVPGIGEN